MGHPDQEDDVAIQREERAIYAFIIVASAPVLVGIAIHGGALDGGGTVSLALVVLGLVGLVAAVRALLKPRIPRATQQSES